MSVISIIGSGFSGLSAACYLAAAGNEVHIFEKNATIGGRARQLKTDNGFLFDMGPSWYWMPDVFESYFNFFGKKASDFYTLKRLNPSYRIYYSKQDVLDVPAGLDALYQMFDKLEPGSSVHLKKFIAEGKYK